MNYERQAEEFEPALTRSILMILKFATGFLLSGLIALAGFNASPSPQPFVEAEAAAPEISGHGAGRITPMDDIDLTDRSGCF